MMFHKNEDPQKFIKIAILEECQTEAEAIRRELAWTFDLFAFTPSGLNVREESSEK